MALADLTYRRVEVSITYSAWADVITAIKTALQATAYTGVYPEGTNPSRTAGSGRAWSLETEVTGEALVCRAPTDGGTPNQRVIIAGSSSVKTPKMASPDTYASSRVLVGLAPNGGTLTTWDGSGANDPMGANNYFSGYWRGSGVVGTLVPTKLIWVESSETFCLFVQYGANLWQGVICGAILEPDSTDSQDCESDGRLYGIITSGGSNAGITADIFSQQARFTGTDALANGVHVGMKLPGQSTWRLMRRTHNFMSSVDGCVTSPSGKVRPWPIVYADNTSPFKVYGYLRGMRMLERYACNAIKTEGGTARWITISANDAPSTGDTLGFKVS